MHCTCEQVLCSGPTRNSPDPQHQLPEQHWISRRADLKDRQRRSRLPPLHFMLGSEKARQKLNLKCLFQHYCKAASWQTTNSNNSLHGNWKKKCIASGSSCNGAHRAGQFCAVLRQVQSDFVQARLYLACLGDGMVAWVPSRPWNSKSAGRGLESEEVLTMEVVWQV